MQSAGIRIHVPVGKAEKFNGDPLYCGINCSACDDITINYKIELDFDPSIYKRINSVIKFLNNSDTELIGGAAELASIEASFLDLAEAIKSYRDAVIKKNSQKRNE